MFVQELWANPSQGLFPYLIRRRIQGQDIYKVTLILLQQGFLPSLGKKVNGNWIGWNPPKMCSVKQQNHLRIDDEADPRNSDEENAGNIHLEILNWKIYLHLEILNRKICVCSRRCIYSFKKDSRGMRLDLIDQRLVLSSQKHLKATGSIFA